MKRQLMEEIVADVNPQALFADGFDEAIIGIASRCGQPSIIAYDYDKCIEVLMSRDGMDWDEASEFFEFNVAGAWWGEHTPCFVSIIQEETKWRNTLSRLKSMTFRLRMRLSRPRSSRDGS